MDVGCFLHYCDYMILDSASISAKLDKVTFGMVMGKLQNPGPMSSRFGNYSSMTWIDQSLTA